MEPLEAPRAGIRGSAWYALTVLTCLNLLNYLDRYVVPAVQVTIKNELGLTDGQVGLLSTGFMVVYMCASPVFGWLGDKRSRTALIGVGVAIWSIATLCSGFAGTFLLLLVTRMFVGVGEAAYGTIAPAVLSDSFAAAIRGRIFAVFYAAIPIGSAMGFLVGGYMSTHSGWRHAFWLTSALGALLAVLAFRLHDPPRGAPGDGEDTCGSAPGLLETYRMLWNNRLYVVTVAGYAAGTFAIGGLGVWLSQFLTTVRKLDNAAMVVGGVMAVSGLVGTIAGGWVGDWYARTNRHAYLWVAGLTSLVAAPVGLVALTVPTATVYLPALFVAGILVFASTGPINTLIVNLVDPDIRATAVAACTLAIHLFGDGFSAWFIGAVSDRFTLERAILMVPLMMCASGLIWTMAAWSRQGKST